MFQLLDPVTGLILIFLSQAEGTRDSTTNHSSMYGVSLGHRFLQLLIISLSDVRDLSRFIPVESQSYKDTEEAPRTYRNICRQTPRDAVV